MIRIEQASTEHIPQMADLLAVLFSEEVEFRPDREKQIRGLRMIIGRRNGATSSSPRKRTRWWAW